MFENLKLCKISDTFEHSRHNRKSKPLNVDEHTVILKPQHMRTVTNLNTSDSNTNDKWPALSKLQEEWQLLNPKILNPKPEAHW